MLIFVVVDLFFFLVKAKLFSPYFRKAHDDTRIKSWKGWWCARRFHNWRKKLWFFLFLLDFRKILTHFEKKGPQNILVLGPNSSPVIISNKNGLRFFVGNAIKKYTITHCISRIVKNFAIFQRKDILFKSWAKTMFFVVNLQHLIISVDLSSPWTVLSQKSFHIFLYLIRSLFDFVTT